MLQKKHPKSKRTTLQKQAGREWKAGKLKKSVGGVKRKKPAAKKVVHKRKAVKRAVKRTVKRRKIGSSGNANTRTATRASTSRNKTATKTITANVKIGSRRKRRAVAKKVYRRRKVGALGGNTLPLVLGGAVLLGLGYMLFKKPTPQYIPTGNVYRDNNASSVLTWATAAGLAATTIAAIIAKLNASSDSAVNSAANNPSAWFAQSQLGD